MHPKETSDTLKHHHKTFHLARHDPERWEQEREITLSEGLHEARERARIAEREAETNKTLLKRSQQQVSCVAICKDQLRTHETKRLTTYGESLRHLKLHVKICARSTRRSLMSSPTRARPWRRRPIIAQDYRTIPQSYTRKCKCFGGRHSVHQSNAPARLTQRS
jgi:hypothetical protein